LEQSAISELEEEIGVKTTLENLESIGKVTNNPTKTTHVTYGYIARNLKYNSRQKLEETENIEILEFSPQEVIKMIKNDEILVADSVAFILKTYFLHPELFSR